jgi:hypothetical protein
MAGAIALERNGFMLFIFSTVNSLAGRKPSIQCKGSAGHGFDRNPGLRPAGADPLQRALRVELLSPVATIQSRKQLLD